MILEYAFVRFSIFKLKIDKLRINSKQIFASNQYQVYCIKLNKLVGKWNKYCQ